MDRFHLPPVLLAKGSSRATRSVSDSRSPTETPPSRWLTVVPSTTVGSAGGAKLGKVLARESTVSFWIFWKDS
jgi:hypothetical protein